MAIGLGTLKQYTVEFIPDTGVVTNGIVDPTSLNGPWSWTVPEDVAMMYISLCGGGRGGAGGGASSTGVFSVGGGGGGCGMSMIGLTPVFVIPNTNFTVIVGSKGLGGAPGVAGTAGGTTVIRPTTPGPGILGAWHNDEVGGLGVAGVQGCLNSGQNLINFPGGSTSVVSSFAPGGNSGGNSDNGSTGTGQSVTQATGGASSVVSQYAIHGSGCYMMWYSSGGGGGGSGATSGSAAGGPSTIYGGGFAGVISNMSYQRSVAEYGAPGNTNGTLSRGGGGAGGGSYFGRGGNAGVGGSNGGNALGYGGGGGGGGGNASGGNGAPGYIKLTFWRST